MPKRISFHVVYATSEDGSNPACELNVQGPAARGWRSASGAPPPHELLLRLTSVAAIHKLQLLAHHQLVRECLLLSDPACELNVQGPAARGWRSAAGAPPPHELLLRLTSIAAIHKLQLLAHHQLVRECLLLSDPACELNVQGPAARGWPSAAGAPPPHELLLRLTSVAAIHKLQLLVHHHLVRECLLLSDPAYELNVQGPAARGWRSAAGAPPPHELLLRLTSVAAIHKLQLLAHHQLVPCSVEVMVSGGVAGPEGAATPCGATYISVGKVALAKPMPQARTRELRSAALPEPTVARFVKLRLSGPHEPGTENDQVALMAVNVLGVEVEEPPPPTAAHAPEPSYSPYDDLAFVMYVDTELAELVRTLDTRKKSAIAEERFEYARRLKSAGAALAAAGLRVGRWRLRKRLAAARDDYEVARRMRDRIAGAMLAVAADRELRRLLEDEGLDPLNDSSMPEEYDFMHHLEPSIYPAGLSFDIPSPQPPFEVTLQAQSNANSIETHLPEPEEKHELIEEDGVRANMQDLIVTTHQQELNSKVALENEDHKIEYGTREDVLEVQKINGIDGVDFVETIKMRSPSPIPTPPLAPVERAEPAKEEPIKGTDSPRRSITPNRANGVLVKRRNKSAGPRSTYEAYEERLLPALRHSHTNEYLRECGRGAEEEAGSAAGSAGSHTRPPHKLNERERKLAALPILIFGYQLVEKFFSKTYLDKEEGLSRLRSELTSPVAGSSKTSPNKTARAAAILLQRLLRDKVFSVYSQANELVRVLFQEFMPERVCSAEVGRCLERLLPELLRAAGDPAPRVHSTAQHTVLTIADCPHVRSLHLIPQQLVRPVPASTHPRMALSRLQMLEQLVETHGISTEKNSGLTVRRLAECGAAGAQHAAGAVRAAAERILLAAYGRSPRVVRAQLPPDDAVTRRNLIYRHLFQQFDRIDMQKMLSKAPSEDVMLNGSTDSTNDAVSVVQSTHSGVTSTLSGMTSLGMTSSYGRMTGSISMMSSMTASTGMTTSISGSTLAPSSLGSSTTSRTKSSLKKTPARRYSARPARDFSNYPGYNKLRLDSAVSPKHSPKNHSVTEKVHFEDKHRDKVVYRKANRNPENRHSMIHYDHENSKPELRERPITVYDPVLPEYHGDSSSIGSPKIAKHDLRSLDSFSIDSPKMSTTDLRSLESLGVDSKVQDYYKTGGPDSPKVSLLDKSCDREYFRDSTLDSPKMAGGLKNLHLDEGQMDESGYYSPGDTRTGRQMAILRSKSGINVAEYCDQHFDSFEGGATTGDISSGENTPEPLYSTQCTWCGRTVRAGGLDAHYWRRCVLLARCLHCHQVLEARVLHSHLLDECTESGNMWARCGECSAALRGDEGSYHAHCQPCGADEWKCPYCLSNVLARDQPWQRHLMQCSRNPRVLVSAT